MKILIFGGTTEGRKLADILCKHGIYVTLSVATEYGRDVISRDVISGDITSQNPFLKVNTGRLSRDGMAALLEGGFDYVVDATHPYADIATQNIKAACEAANIVYLRLIRDEGEKEQSVIYADTAADAANLLKATIGNVLITVGSKELESFTVISDYPKRLYIRILPMVDSLQKAIGLGYNNSNIICMQGPFDIDMNKAVLKMTNAAYMVTKDSGDAGGFREKLAAAEQMGCKVIVVKRPDSEKGYSLGEILRLLGIS